jgi:uncharacterized membrane protein
MKKNQKQPLSNNNIEAILILIFAFVVVAMFQNW